MRPWSKLVIGLTLVGAAIAALIYLSRRKTTVPASGSATSPALTSSMWAVSDALQQTHLNALSDQLAAVPSRVDIASMIDQALSKVPIGPAFTREQASLMIQQAIAGLGSGNGSTTDGGSSAGTDTDLAAQFNQEMN